MPFIILEDSKGFKKSHGWVPVPTPVFYIPVLKSIAHYNKLPPVEIEDCAMTTQIAFYRDKEVYPDVYLYKEQI